MDKIIEEIANDIAQMCPDLVEDCCGHINCVTCLAKGLIKQGYRKQVEAEWIDLHKGKYENPLYVCSACRKGAYLRVEADELNNPKMVQALTDYCPHCSAKMKGAE